MNKFVILAVADISKSNQNIKDEGNQVNGNQRNMITVENEERDSSDSYWNRQTNSTQGRLKFILKPQSAHNEQELVTAFEYDGSIVKRSGIDQKSLVGCILQVNSNLDICRGIILLTAAYCQVYSTNNAASTTHLNHTHSNNSHTYADSGMDEELLAELFNGDDEAFTFD